MQINIVISTYLYSRQKAKMLQFIIHQFCLAKLRKRHETTLGKARKVAAEGKNMKLVSDFLLLQRLESDVFADFGEHLRGDAEK